MKSNLISIFFIGFLASTAVNAASFEPQPISFAQRYCPDVDFDSNTTAVNGIACTWHAQDNDATMSLTTHFKDPNIDYVAGSCAMTPADNNNHSVLTLVRGAKAAFLSNVVIDNNNTATFILRHVGTDNNANILFTLNGQFSITPDSKPNTYNVTAVNDYAEGDKITCNFEVHRK